MTVGARVRRVVRWLRSDCHRPDASSPMADDHFPVPAGDAWRAIGQALLSGGGLSEPLDDSESAAGETVGEVVGFLGEVVDEGVQS